MAVVDIKWPDRRPTATSKINKNKCNARTLYKYLLTTCNGQRTSRHLSRFVHNLTTLKGRPPAEHGGGIL